MKARMPFEPPAWRALILGLIGLAMGCLPAPARDVQRWDFRDSSSRSGWQALHDLTPLRFDETGMSSEITGTDPYLSGPPLTLPQDSPLWLTLELRSSQGGGGQVFYFRDHPSEEDSVRFTVPSGSWATVRLPLPPQPPGTRLRLDPPGQHGRFTLQEIRCERRAIIEEPDWPKPEPVKLTKDALQLRAGSMELRHDPGRWGAWEVKLSGQSMATGLTRPLLGYTHQGETRWVRLPSVASARLMADSGRLSVRVDFSDPDGARWKIERVFIADDSGDAIQVETTISVDQERPVVYLPLLHLLAGVNSFGREKTQGLFAGLEYLANEPSSSEADVRGPAANRRVPDTLKITFPLMAIHSVDRYVALSWKMEDDVAAVFDSPDRTFHSEAHLMGLILPGSNGGNRPEGSLAPYEGMALRAGEARRFRAMILGGLGTSIADAIRHYTKLTPPPRLPEPVPDLEEYIGLASAGWLDSKIREGNHFRHAVWGSNFGAGPSGDAAVFMNWLAAITSDPSLRSRLARRADLAAEAVPNQLYSHHTVSHIPLPTGALVFGNVLGNVDHAVERARRLLTRFNDDNRIVYQPSPGRPDYSATHFSRDANGLEAALVAQLLQLAAFSGDSDLLERGRERLDGLNRFRLGVPRGAQTWEIPLHTPDILASAHLVNAYALGHVLYDEESYLRQAEYWAWTGLPFVYLRHPANENQPIGPYATIPVYGATGWVSPVWFGLPVQWCGMVYADALRNLNRHLESPFWRQIADGITASGIQQTWPHADPNRAGLLPDFTNLRSQYRDGPAINPGTVQAAAPAYYGALPIHDFVACRLSPVRIHAPGKITLISDQADQAILRIEAWPRQTCRVLINRCPDLAGIRLNDHAIRPGVDPGHEWRPRLGILVLEVEGNAGIRLDFNP